MTLVPISTVMRKMIEEKYAIAIGVYLKKNKNVNRYKNRLHRFREGKLGLWSKISILLEMGYKLVLFGDTITVIEPTSDASL